jgi:hypothetical protein
LLDRLLALSAAHGRQLPQRGSLWQCGKVRSFAKASPFGRDGTAKP